MSNVIIMPDGTPVDITGMPEEQVILMIEASQELMPSEPEPEPPQQEDYLTRENLMTGNPIEDAAIGLGRFATEVGQGIKQKWKMATGTDEEAQEYTDKINEERRLWDKGTEGAGMEDVGYYGGMLAPGLLTGGAGVAGTAAIGALEAGILPTSEPEWQQAFNQAVIGAGFAGGLRAVPELGAAFKQWRKNVQLGKVDQDIVALAEQYGVKVPRSVNRPSVLGKIAEEGANLPVVGRPGAAGMKRDAADTLDQMSRNARTGENVDEAFKYGKKELEEINSKAWTQTHKLIGDAPIDRQHLNNVMESIKQSMGDTTIGRQQAEEVNRVWGKMRERPRFEPKAGGQQKTLEEYRDWERMWDAQDEVRGFSGDNLEALHKFRAQFGAQNKAAWQQKGWEESTRKAVYKALSDEMYSAASRSYGEEGVKLLQKAVDDTKQMHRTVKNTGVMQGAINDQLDRNSLFVNAALSGDKDKMQAMKTILGKEGAPTVQKQIYDDVANVFRTSGGAAAAKRIKKLDSSVETFFGADQASALRGLGKFMDNIPADKQGWMRNWLGGSAVTAAAITNPLKVAAGGAAIRQWTKRQDVIAMLQKLSTTAKDSPLYKALTNELTESMMIAGGVEQSRPPMEVEIRDGVPQ